MSVLKKIKTNKDLRKVPPDRIPLLCREIRDFLVGSVSKTGGHLASNLGVVELTVALHRVYDPMQDRILFDVGHQAYVHKMLTGRMEYFDTLRSMSGLSGFPLPSESNADPFLAGHASDAVSVALGMARARTLRGDNYDVVAILGDGALTGGLSYEALNDAGESGEPIVVILNDNDMSINRSVGAVARILRRARMKPSYRRFKKAYQTFLKRFPPLYKLSHKIKEKLKTSLLDPGIFDEMGFHYIGPVDGHNEKELEKVISWAKALREPALVHIHTVKGKGYAPAEADPELYHGVGPFNPNIGVTRKNGDDYSAHFGESLVRLAEKDASICAVTAAMEGGTGLEAFAARFPERFFEVGIAEEHAAAMCAGLAKQGMKPVFAVYSTFLQRSYDMLLSDIGLLGLHVVLAVDRAGIVGEDGVTHQGSFDIAYLSTVPGMQIFAPANYAELEAMLKHALYNVSGPAAIRYPRGRSNGGESDLSRGNTALLQEGGDVTVVTYGSSLAQTVQAAGLMRADGIEPEFIKINRVFPLDAEPILTSLRKTGRLLVVEEACRTGGVGNSILTETAKSGILLKGVRQLDLGSGVIPHGTRYDLTARLGMTVEDIENAAKELMNEESAT